METEYKKTNQPMYLLDKETPKGWFDYGTNIGMGAACSTVFFDFDPARRRNFFLSA